MAGSGESALAQAASREKGEEDSDTGREEHEKGEE